MPQTFYTKEEFEVERKIGDIFIGSFYEIEQYFEYEDKNKRKLNWDSVEYPFIPLHSHEFIEAILEVKKCIADKHPYRNIRFLDVGCGPGTKLLLAYNAGFVTSGIELCPDLCAIAKKIARHSEISCCNALNYKRYNEHDVIYYYCPIRNNEKQQELEILIESQMKVGAYLIPVLKKDYSITKDKRFKKIENKNCAVFYKKIKE